MKFNLLKKYKFSNDKEDVDMLRFDALQEVKKNESLSVRAKLVAMTEIAVFNRLNEHIESMLASGNYDDISDKVICLIEHAETDLYREIKEMNVEG